MTLNVSLVQVKFWRTVTFRSSEASVSAHQEIPFGVTGEVVHNTFDPRRFIQVLDDRQGPTGGFYVLWSDSPTFDGEVFDNWFEDEDALHRFFESAQLRVDWPEADGLG